MSDYQDGYDDGYVAGYSDGYNDGYDQNEYNEGEDRDENDDYDEGFNCGYNEGYEAGYEAGQDDCDNGEDHGYSYNDGYGDDSDDDGNDDDDGSDEDEEEDEVFLVDSPRTAIPEAAVEPLKPKSTYGVGTMMEHTPFCQMMRALEDEDRQAFLRIVRDPDLWIDDYTLAPLLVRYPTEMAEACAIWRSAREGTTYRGGPDGMSFIDGGNSGHWTGPASDYASERGGGNWGTSSDDRGGNWGTSSDDSSEGDWSGN